MKHYVLTVIANEGRFAVEASSGFIIEASNEKEAFIEAGKYESKINCKIAMEPKPKPHMDIICPQASITPQILSYNYSMLIKKGSLFGEDIPITEDYFLRFITREYGEKRMSFEKTAYGVRPLNSENKIESLEIELYDLPKMLHFLKTWESVPDLQAENERYVTEISQLRGENQHLISQILEIDELKRKNSRLHSIVDEYEYEQ